MKILQHKIPDTWQWVEISQIGNIETGTTPSKKDKSNYGVDFPFYKPTELEAGINVRESRERLSKKGIKKARLLPKNSILVTCIGATIGKTGIIRNEGASNQQINSIIPVGSIKPNFVYYQVICPLFQNQIIKRSSSTTLPILNKSRFSKLLFALPSQNEQNRIVEKIEELFSDLGKATEDLKKIQEQLKIYRQAVLKAAFEGKLTEKWRRKNELKLPEEILKIRHNNIKEIYKIPVSWKWLFLNDIGFVVSGGTPSTKEPKYFNGEIPWITPKDLSGYNKKYISKGSRNISKKGLKKSSAKLLPKGSIVFSSRAPIGYTAITENELCTNQGFKNLVLNDGINSEYVYYYLRNNKSLAERYASGTTFKEISGSKFAILPMPLCNLKEQEQVVNEIESRLSVCDKIEKTVEYSLNKIKYLRQSILKKAFEGKLVPQDPNDEPTEKLLERIKQEKRKFEFNNKKRKTR